MSNDDHQTLYDIFDLEHNATGAQILARYRILRDELLAESIPYDDPQFITLNDAYRVLSDTVKRAEYDDELKAKGLYHAVERVDERTSLADLFDLDDDDDLLDEEELLIETVDIEEDKHKNQSTRPKVTRTFNHEEKIRELEVYQHLARLQSKQEAFDELSQYPKSAHRMDRDVNRRLQGLGLLVLVVIIPVFVLLNEAVDSIHVQRTLSIGIALGIILTIMGINAWVGRRWKKQTQKRINIAKQQLEELAPSTTNNLLASDDSEENTTTPSNFYDDEDNQHQHSDSNF